MILAACALALLAQAPHKPDDFLRIEKVAPGVYTAVRNEPPGLAVDCNVTFIINDDDVIVVDANIGPESASATIRALKKLTNKPVSMLINTHYHDDHIGGNSTFKAAYPGIKFVAHKSTEDNIQKYAVASRKSMIETAPQMTRFLHMLIDKKKGYSGEPITDEERNAYLNDIRIADRYSKEMPAVKFTPPDILVDDQLTLHRGKRTIEIRYLGAGHTGSDLVVWMPQDDVLVAGDLVVWPIPLIGSPQSNMKQWPVTLQALLDLGPAAIVPGHGAIMRGGGFVEALIRMFNSINKQVGEGVARGDKLEDLQKSIDLSEFERGLVGSSHLRKTLFDLYCREPAISESYAEQTAK